MCFVQRLAPLTSVVRYVLVGYGPRAYEAGLRRLATQIVNVKVRRIAAVSGAARFAALHMPADSASMPNLYTLQCRKTVRAALGAENNAAQRPLLP